MKAKEKIMARLRMASDPFPAALPVRDYLPVSPIEDITPPAFKKHFIQAAGELSCTVYEPKNSDETAQILAKIIKPDTQISAWDWSQIPFAGLKQTLNEMDVRVGDPDDPHVRVGITGANAALAATGSLVLDRNSGRPTAPSLLPPVHIAIITENQILPHFEAWVAQQRLDDDLAAFRGVGNIAIISGPSRTGDIAMQMILGMHGPKELHIIILQTPM